MRNLKTLFFPLFTLITLLFQSCGDPCDAIIISSDCTCNDGVVICADPNPCENVTCPTGYYCDNGNCELEDFATEQKSGLITTDEVWTADKCYVLNNKVVIEDGITLTIEAGTVIKGAEGTGSLASTLIVARGGKLMAEGTAEKPIIFTSVLDNITPGQSIGTNLDETQSALWGGLIILGKAPISVGDNSGEAQIEGIPADDSYGTYGGTDAADNSGVIQYISVRHGGALIGDGNEINGVTLGGVGNGTVIENIEVVANLDDGIEWFGGTVNVKNALIWAADDDAIDIDQAYSGTIDNAIVIASSGTDHCLEIDGPEGIATGTCMITNLTIKGADDEIGQYRDGATCTTSNAYFFGFDKVADGEGDLSLDDATNLLGLTFSNIEVTLTTDATTISEMLKNGIDAFGTTVAEGANTVGANSSVFDWTFTSKKGALNF